MMKLTKTMFLSLLLVVALVLPSFMQVPVEAKTAGKKKVTVWNEKKLKSALKSSKVGTIEFISSTHSEITIRSTRSKNKKIIISAPNATIKNTARFKTIEVIAAQSYTEAVSGNTIKANKNFVHVAEGVEVKKLVFSDPEEINYNLDKGASVKSLVIADDDHMSTFDRATRTLVFDTTDVLYSDVPIHYTAVMDESGRILRSTYTNSRMEYRKEFKYDETGEMIESKRYDLTSGDPELTSYFEYKTEYKSDGSRYDETIDHTYDPTPVIYKYYYDTNGRLLESHISGAYFSKNVKNTYDENGLLIYYEGSKSEIDKNNREYSESYTNTLSYDKNGMMIKQVYEEESKMSIRTYEYDKTGECVKQTYADYTKCKDGSLLPGSHWEM